MKTIAALLKLLSVFVLPPVVVLGIGYLWDEGYLGFYWERYSSLYDPKLGVFRCLDENGELAQGIEPPCLVATSRGAKAQIRHAKQCEDDGGDSDSCSVRAYEWLLSRQPRTP